jgi:hypothetical protein
MDIRSNERLAPTLGSCWCGVQLHSQCADHFHDSRELGIARRRQSFVQALSTKACFACNVGHTLCASDISECGSNERCVPFFECRLKVGYHVIFGLEVVRRVPRRGDSLGHTRTPINHVQVLWLGECLNPVRTYRLLRVTQRIRSPSERNRCGSQGRSSHASPKFLHRRVSRLLGFRGKAYESECRCEPWQLGREVRQTSPNRLWSDGLQA